jgi:hypothetical protein
MPVLVPYKSQKTCAQKEMNVQEDEEKPAFLLLGCFGEKKVGDFEEIKRLDFLGLFICKPSLRLLIIYDVNRS